MSTDGKVSKIKENKMKNGLRIKVGHEVSYRHPHLSERAGDGDLERRGGDLVVVVQLVPDKPAGKLGVAGALLFQSIKEVGRGELLYKPNSDNPAK